MGMMYPNREQGLLLVPPSDLTPYEGGLTMGSHVLRQMILNFAEQAVLLYAQNAGSDSVPERFIQGYCATALMHLGFIAMVEINQGECCDWLGVLDRAKASRDMVIFDPSEDANPDKARFRAVVEFKRSAWNIHDDIVRTTNLVHEARSVVKDEDDTDSQSLSTFGFIVVCGYSTRVVASEIAEIERMAGSLNVGEVLSQKFSQTLGNGFEFNSFVAGVPCGDYEWPEARIELSAWRLAPNST
jgi:hypothetical protein